MSPSNAELWCEKSFPEYVRAVCIERCKHGSEEGEDPRASNGLVLTCLSYNRKVPGSNPGRGAITTRIASTPAPALTAAWRFVFFGEQ